MFGMRGDLLVSRRPMAAASEYFVRQPDDAWRGYAIKWDGGEITYRPSATWAPPMLSAWS